MGGTGDLLLEKKEKEEEKREEKEIRGLAARAASPCYKGLNPKAQQQRGRVLLGCC